MSREVLLCVVVLAASLAGCIGGEGDPSSAGQEARNESAPSWAKLGNVTVDGTNRTHANATSAAFGWDGQTPANTTLAVPTGGPFRLEVTATTEAGQTLDLHIRADGVTWLCSETDESDTDATCIVRSLAQEQGTRWSIELENGATVKQSVPFTAEVTVQALDPATAPPIPARVPEPTNQNLDPGWPSIEDSTIRPGVNVGSCTGNFIFRSPDNATLYIGTAAHCVDDLHLGDPYTINPGPSTGPSVNDITPVEGRVAYCSWGALHGLLTCPRIGEAGNLPGRWNDFALIEIPDEQRDAVHPAMLVWGGPTHIGEPPAPGTQLLTYGNSDSRDQGQDINVGDSRTGVVFDSTPEYTAAYFLPHGIPGDSGSPVITADGATVGAFKSLNAQFTNEARGWNGVTNLDHALAMLENTTGHSIELATWPLFDTPRSEPLPSAHHDKTTQQELEVRR